MFNAFTRFNLVAGQYLLYVYLIVLTLIVIFQIDKLHEANTRLMAYVSKHESHNREDNIRQLNTDKYEQLLLKKLDIERKELHYEITVLKQEVKELRRNHVSCNP